MTGKAGPGARSCPDQLFGPNAATTVRTNPNLSVPTFHLRPFSFSYNLFPLSSCMPLKSLLRREQSITMEHKASNLRAMLLPSQLHTRSDQSTEVATSPSYNRWSAYFRCIPQHPLPSSSTAGMSTPFLFANLPIEVLHDLLLNAAAILHKCCVKKFFYGLYLLSTFTETSISAAMDRGDSVDLQTKCDKEESLRVCRIFQATQWLRSSACRGYDRLDRCIK